MTIGATGADGAGGRRRSPRVAVDDRAARADGPVRGQGAEGPGDHRDDGDGDSRDGDCDKECQDDD
eukprot:6723356-Pyramimonas_sp.AAC.2